MDDVVLRRELAEARQQLAATGEILTAIGRSASDLEAVLTVVSDSARRLCRADAAVIYLLDGRTFRVAAATGVSDEYLAYVRRHPMLADRTSLTGRVTLERRAQQLEDVLADPEYRRQDVQRVGGFRTALGVPMLVENEVVGVVNLWREAVQPFSARAIELVTTFAAQAAIAIRNVDLVRAFQARTTELADKVEQLEALGQVGKAVSSSLDLDEVLTRIVSLAVQLTDTDGGSVFELDTTTSEFRIRAAYGSSEDLVATLRRTRIALDNTLVGRACRESQPHMVSNLLEVPLDPHLQVLADTGWRSILAVPIQHEGVTVGALVVRRRTPGDFSTEMSDLLTTFASQSALAIVNARLFQELADKSAELQLASRHKSEFLASMSHELRTPLNAVIGFSDVLLERMFGELNDRQEEYLRDIRDSGRHLLELLNDILDLSKVEAGRMQLEPLPFAVRPALEHCVAQVRERAAMGEVTMTLDVHDGVDTIDADELRFKQVVLNLLSNAVKFSNQGGRVVVRATVDDEGLNVTVDDNGVGIAAEDRERIFESFEQAGRTRSHSEGTGLGLTLSRRIVDLLGGRMWLESELGIGSTFGFVVPRRTPAADRPQLLDQADSPVVVVIEDDRRALELISLYLDSAGIRSVSAHDGTTGLATVRELDPAAVLLDIRLPGMDGWQVLRSLKEDVATASTPVVVITILDERPRALALGAADYLVKPVSREGVLGALAGVGLAGRRSGTTWEEP